MVAKTSTSSFFFLAELLSVRRALVNERAKACKEAKGNRKPPTENKQANKTNQTKKHKQDKPKTPQTPQQRKTLCSEDGIRTRQVKNGSMRHISKASYDASRSRMSEELKTRKLS